MDAPRDRSDGRRAAQAANLAKPIRQDGALAVLHSAATRPKRAGYTSATRRDDLRTACPQRRKHAIAGGRRRRNAGRAADSAKTSARRATQHLAHPPRSRHVHGRRRSRPTGAEREIRPESAATPPRRLDAVLGRRSRARGDRSSSLSILLLGADIACSGRHERHSPPARRLRRHCDARALRAMGLPAGRDQARSSRHLARDAGCDPIRDRHPAADRMGEGQADRAVRARRHAGSGPACRTAVRWRVRADLRGIELHDRLAHGRLHLSRPSADRARSRDLRARRAARARAMARRGDRVRGHRARISRGIRRRRTLDARRRCVRYPRSRRMGRDDGADPRQRGLRA